MNNIIALYQRKLGIKLVAITLKVVVRNESKHDSDNYAYAGGATNTTLKTIITRRRMKNTIATWVGRWCGIIVYRNYSVMVLRIWGPIISKKGERVYWRWRLWCKKSGMIVWPVARLYRDT